MTSCSTSDEDAQQADNSDGAIHEGLIASIIKSESRYQILVISNILMEDIETFTQEEIYELSYHYDSSLYNLSKEKVKNLKVGDYVQVHWDGHSQEDSAPPQRSAEKVDILTIKDDHYTHVGIIIEKSNTETETTQRILVMSHISSEEAKSSTSRQLLELADQNSDHEIAYYSLAARNLEHVKVEDRVRVIWEGNEEMSSPPGRVASEVVLLLDK